MIQTTICGPSLKIEKLEGVDSSRVFEVPAMHAVVGFYIKNAYANRTIELRVDGGPQVMAKSLDNATGAGYLYALAGPSHEFVFDTATDFIVKSQDDNYTDVYAEVLVVLLDLSAV